MSQLVRVEIDGPVATISLCRPERHNSLVPELLEQLIAAADSLASAPGLRAAVLRAEGRSFSTGGDVRAIAESEDRPVYAARLVGLLNQAILALIGQPLPLVAAVQGVLTGGSLGLMLAADVALLSPEASITPYYTTVGFSPDGGWTAMLPEQIGRRRAAEGLLLDRSIGADEAVAIGLASRVVPAARIDEEAMATAHAMAVQLPGSARSARRLLWGDTAALAARLEAERAAFVAQIASAEAERGMAAFLQRRRG
ncbi:enoyl-CoA hydratase/isomerase family protein [Chloroflexales bacterium ZM16-3]|nr:enoyl-CoA hydratase/isomerase family protein [Chloroflexales bacterium ZM16-3]